MTESPQPETLSAEVFIPQRVFLYISNDSLAPLVAAEARLRLQHQAAEQNLGVDLSAGTGAYRVVKYVTAEDGTRTEQLVAEQATDSQPLPDWEGQDWDGVILTITAPVVVTESAKEQC